MKLANGNIYDGDWVDGLREGKGIVRWQNGNCYEGDFQGDKMNGR